MIHTWTDRPHPDAPAMVQGRARDRAEHSADLSYQERVLAPPCPVCGRGVEDKDWDRHKYEQHGVNDGLRPWGTPDAREALFVAADPDDLDRKIAAWRRTHPGVRLRPLGDGRVAPGSPMRFLRFRVEGRR